MHLEGSLSPTLLFELSQKNNITLPTDNPDYASVPTLEDRYTRFTNLDDFLAYYYIGMSVLITESDFERLAWEYFKKAHSQGVRHSEVFFDPQAHTSRGIDIATVINGFTKARLRAEEELGVSSLLIMCFLRHLPPADAVATFEAARAHVEGKVDAVGLDSSELGYAAAPFKDAFREAEKMGLRLTAHAGEEGPAENVWEALDHLGVSRVDHGTRAVEDERLLEHLAERKTLLTVCPLSNVQLKGIKEVGELPLRRFMEKEVRFSLNSDDPAYFGGYILENYCAVHEAFGFTHKEWEWVARNSIEGSWCAEERKEYLLRELEEVMGSFSSR